ncbi:MAG: LPD28 domain-containing protein [Oscillospiraceae bacterium]|nr:LPD28 domain-containing protein [Oscillospiraceae bacterium]
MRVNAYDETYEYVELFGKPALFTNARVDRDTVPEGWYAYDLRGSDNDPGEPVTVEANVAVNHVGTILIHEPVTIPKSGYRPLKGRLDFLGERYSLKEFCEVRGLNYPAENPKYTLRPASDSEAGHFNSQEEKDEIIGKVSFASGETLAYTDPTIFLQVIRDELPYKPTSGFQYEVLTDDPTVRKRADDILYDLFGEKSPRPFDDYEKKPNAGITMGGL